MIVAEMIENIGSFLGVRRSIMQTLIHDRRFETFATVLEEADLDEMFIGEGSFTVFAPTDIAFSRVPERTLASLMKDPERGPMRDILLYHVVSGTLPRVRSRGLLRASDVAGEELRISAEIGLQVNDARITLPNIRCTNGMIHGIDALLMPP
jgi:transforming growth factor-beta-induced protein